MVWRLLRAGVFEGWGSVGGNFERGRFAICNLQRDFVSCLRHVLSSMRRLQKTHTVCSFSAHVALHARLGESDISVHGMRCLLGHRCRKLCDTPQRLTKTLQLR